VVLACVLLVPARVAAGSPIAEVLFQEGRRLLLSGRTAEACSMLRESQAIEASSGTLLNLALCDERLGRTASAFDEYREAARLARQQGRNDRAAVAVERGGALEPRLARVTVVAPHAPPGMIVEFDDGPSGGHGLGVPLAVNPGLRRLTVSAPKHRPWTTSLDLRDGDLRVLEVPPLQTEKEEPTRSPGSPEPQSEPAPSLPPVPHRQPSADVRDTRPLISGSAPGRTERPRFTALELSAAAGGGALLVAGGVFWMMAYSRYQAGLSACNAGAGCLDHEGRVASIQTLKTIAIGSLISGGAVLGATFVLHELRGRSTESTTVAFDPVAREFSLSRTF
jgi:hypothetical protein